MKIKHENKDDFKHSINSLQQKLLSNLPLCFSLNQMYLILYSQTPGLKRNRMDLHT